MEPMLAKRIYMDPDGLFRGSFDIYVEGDWTDGDGGACDDNGGQGGPQDCEELNISISAGPNLIDTHHETGLVVGDNTVVFNFAITETTPIDWDGDQYNPEIRVNSGDEVTITTNNVGKSFHAFGVVSNPDDFNSIIFDSAIAAATNPLKPGESGSVTFLAGAPGTYYYICTVPGHALQGMQGLFIVE